MPKQNSMNPCGDCSIYTCSWLREHKPIDGWKATPTKIKNQRAENGVTEYLYTDSFKIKYCPLFEKNERKVEPAPKKKCTAKPKDSIAKRKFAYKTCLTAAMRRNEDRILSYEEYQNPQLKAMEFRLRENKRKREYTKRKAQGKSQHIVSENL